MSDDKREKLREYLRNNRPRNRVNLGNSSDNKEDSNKNLEDGLNLDNSQILHNKTNSHKRDYDKKTDYHQRLWKFLSAFYIFIPLVYYSDDMW